MRILFTHSGNMYGGVETMLATFARHRDLCPTMQQHFALCFEGRLRDELDECGVPLHDLGYVRIRQPLSVRRARQAFGNLLRDVAFDAVICQSAWSHALFGPVARTAGVPLITWIHGIPDRDSWLEQWARRTPADLTICNSEFTAQLFRKSAPAARVEVLHCPVAPPAQSFSKGNRARVRTELKTPNDAVVIIQASRMEPWKGHQTLLDALAALRDSDRWVCWIVGGPQRPNEVGHFNELIARAQDLGIADRLRFTGQQSHVEALLAAADIFCQPNIDPEPFGIAFVEALYAGLPVITTEIGGALEIMTPRCGALVEPRNVPQLSSVLRQLINDRALRCRLGSAGPWRATTLCDPAQQITKLQQLLKSAPLREMAA
ncbi:MAG TPA: glycosyltransferase family 4 protein [Pyrinomonadaceae bacterium]|nr:glycosyltransferase family 4 protein [Pyrinomonadaceae bacterium]